MKREICLREVATGFLTGVYMLLLGGNVCAGDVGFAWDANTDFTTEYRVYMRPMGQADWNPYIQVPGIDTTVLIVNDVTPGMYEATITAWSNSYYGDPMTPVESDYFTPYLTFFVEPGKCQTPGNFRLQ